MTGTLYDAQALVSNWLVATPTTFATASADQCSLTQKPHQDAPATLTDHVELKH